MSVEHYFYNFLDQYWFLHFVGLFLITIGAITGVYPSSNGTCVISAWSTLVGYTLELAPIFVKAQAMNRVNSSFNEICFRRIDIDPKRMKKFVFVFICPVLIYLIVWTAIDMPKSIESLTMSDNRKNMNIVYLDRCCLSTSVVWSVMGYIWQFLLLLSSVVLAIQSSKVQEKVKESQLIGFLAYSHFMFLIFRIVAHALILSGSVPGTIGSSVESILLSVDVITGTTIFFGHKF